RGSKGHVHRAPANDRGREWHQAECSPPRSEVDTQADDHETEERAKHSVDAPYVGFHRHLLEIRTRWREPSPSGVTRCGHRVPWSSSSSPGRTRRESDPRMWMA